MLMNRRIITLAAIAALATAPGFAAAADLPEPNNRAVGIGLVAGGLFGALLGGPPGAIAGMTFAGIATDREQAARRADALAAQASLLEQERRSLLSERMSLKASVAELGRQLDHERALAESTIDAASLADGLEFAVGFRTSSALPPEALDEGLEALALLVGALPSLEVHLDGYADPRGSEQLNHALSRARAEAVRDRLIDAGVQAERIHITAHGAVIDDAEERAVDPDGWALQRRVHVRLQSAEGRLVSRP
jgi:outer membrane protein OmpA-like peptidoglycan-associated protein